MMVRANLYLILIIIDLEDNEIKNSQQKKQILKEQMKMLNNQDAHLDDLQVITGKMRDGNRIINEELQAQHQLLKELDIEMSRTNSQFKKADLKLRKLIHSSSKFSMWMIILFELFMLFFISVLM